MALEEMKCKHCKTTYYGNPELDDGYCFMCNTTRKLLKIFSLDDLDINDVDFNRIREPEFEEVHKEAGKPLDPKDWRNYIPKGLKAMWQTLPVESRAIAVMFAEREARAVDVISDKVVKQIKEEEA